MSDSSEKAQRGGSMGALAGNFAWLLGGRGFAAIFSLVYMAILTRTLGKEGFGQFSLIIGTGQIVATFVGFHTWQIVVRHGMDRLKRGREGALVGLLKYCMCLDAAGAAVGVALAFGVIFLLAPVFGWSPELVRHALVFAIASLVAVRSTPAGILRLYDRFALAANVEASVTFVRLLLAVIIWLSGPSIAIFILAWATAEIGAAILSWWLAWRTARHLDWNAVPAAPLETLRSTPGLGRFTVVTNISQTIGLAGRQVPVLLTGLFVGPAAAGGFQIALQLGHALTKIGSLAVQTLLPEMMRSQTFEVDRSGFSRLIRGSLGVGIVAGITVVAIVALFGKAALVLIAGQAFASSYLLLLIVALASAINLASVPLEPALYANGGETAALKVRIVVTVVSVIAMLFLGRETGAQGIALAILGAAVMGAVLMAISLRRNLSS